MRLRRNKTSDSYEITSPRLGVPTTQLGVAVPESWIPEIDRLIRVSQDLSDNPYRSRSDLVRRVLADTLEL